MLVGIVLFAVPGMMWLVHVADIDPGRRAYTFGKEQIETIQIIRRVRITCDKDTCTEVCDTAEVAELWRIYDLWNEMQEIQDTKLKTNPSSHLRESQGHAIGWSGIQTANCMSKERVMATE